MTHIIRRFAAVLAFMTLSGIAWGQDAIVLSSTAPGYNVGSVVAGDEQLTVPDGASLALLFQSGDMLRLGGPFHGTIHPPHAAGGDTSVSRLAELFRAQGTDASVIGGTREAARRTDANDSDDVQVDTQRSGTYCVHESTSIWLMRPNLDHPAIAIRHRGSSRAMRWPEDATRIEWPSDVQIDDSSRFMIETPDLGRSIMVTFRVMPDDLPNAAARIFAGIILGCQEQYGEKLRRAGLETVSPEIWITTDHGRQPRYKPGSPVQLTIRASVDGYVYCVMEGRDGGTTPIFPAGSIEGARLGGSIALTLPGRRQPDALIAGPDLHKVRCWLADRDISAELPSALVAKPARLPDRLAGDLDELFTHIESTSIAKSALTIETE